MLSRINMAGRALPAPVMVAAALLVGGVMLTGCASEDPEEAPLEITAEEVPIIREGEDEEEPSPEDAGEELEAPDEPAPEPGPPVIEDELPDDDADDESRGLLSVIGGVLRTLGVFLGKLLFVLVLPAAVAGTLVGMPGSLLVLADAVVFSAFHGWAVPPWWVLLILLAIAAAAEAAEHVLSFSGVRACGASNTTGVWVMVGGFGGAVFGGLLAPMLAGIGALAGPVGWVVLAIIPPIGLGTLGGYLGGYYYELKTGKEPEAAKQAGWGALKGRLAGSFAKAMLVAVMAAIVLISTWGALF